MTKNALSLKTVDYNRVTKGGFYSEGTYCCNFMLHMSFPQTDKPCYFPELEF